MLDFYSDKRNLTTEQLRDREASLRAEVLDIGKRIEEKPESLTPEDSLRINDVDAWLKASGKIVGSRVDGGFKEIPSMSYSERKDRDIAFGRFAQAVFCASAPAGNRVGELETGRVYNSILEQRSEGLDSQPSLGGFLIGETFSEELIGSLYSPDRLPGMVRKVTLSGNTDTFKQSGFDETSRANGSRWGGIQSYYVAGGAEKTKSKPKFRQIEMSLIKLIGLCYAEDSLIQDAARLGEYLREAFTDEINFKLNASILSGNGSGQPLGVLNSGALVTVDKESGQVADSIIWDNILAMLKRYRPMIPGAGVWVTNQDCIGQLLSMSIPIGTAGIPVYQPSNIPGGAGMLAGMRVLYNEAAPTLGDVGDILLMDPRAYLLIDKAGIQSASSIHLRFQYDETTYRWVYRHNGQPLFASPITPYTGSDTVSPFVCVQARE